ncbi:MAG: DUF1847 domain-containing protein [Promethearchaeati archaeon SRVP18_Atabeyarchaeia-1]
MVGQSNSVKESLLAYDKHDERRLAVNAGIVEAAGYAEWPRLREIAEFAKLMGYGKLGLAFCVGLKDEAALVAQFLEGLGFEVCSVNCKFGAISKSDVGVPTEYQGISKTGYAIGYCACNPVGQALVLEKAGTELNILLGLCVGHDTHFIKCSKAPITILAAKDRVTGHNPLAILYSSYGKNYLQKAATEMKSNEGHSQP